LRHLWRLSREARPPKGVAASRPGSAGSRKGPDGD
jgi:hypothetical protein